MVDGFLSGLGHRAHGNYYAVGIGSAIVIKQAIFAAGYLGNLVHVFLYDLRHGIVVGVA